MIAAGADNVDAVCQATGASSVCGSCRPLVNELLGEPVSLEVNRFAPVMILTGLFALLLALGFLLPFNLPYPDSVQVNWRWDLLWRDGFIKQVTGFSLLGVVTVGLVLSLRKRFKRFSWLGEFASWRLVHLLLGMLALTVL